MGFLMANPNSAKTADVYGDLISRLTLSPVNPPDTSNTPGGADDDPLLKLIRHSLACNVAGIVFTAEQEAEVLRLAASPATAWLVRPPHEH